MSTITRLELVSEKDEPAETANPLDPEVLRANAAELAHRLDWLPNVRSSEFLAQRWNALEQKLSPILRRLHAWRGAATSASEDFRSLRDNVNLVSAGLEGTRDASSPQQKLPHVRTMDGEVVPRVHAIAEALLGASDYQFSESVFSAYLEAFQEGTALEMKEFWALIAAIKMVLLEQVAIRGAQLMEDDQGSVGAAVCVRSLREVGQTPWREVIEPLILFDRVLRKDPAGTYPQMDFDSRAQYRAALVNIAEYSDFSEHGVALAALALARQAQQEACSDPKEQKRYAHIGYYLVSDGVVSLHQKAGFRPPLGQRFRSFLKQHPDEFYLPAIAGLTFAIMSAIILLLTAPNSPPLLILLTMLALLLPCSQSALQVVNYLVTSLLKPQILPKLDYSEGIAQDCTTLVAVPTLLLSEDQVRRLVDELEVRFLGNHDRNLHFALLTDLADSPVQSSEDDPLVALCATLVQGLNEKYAGREMGSFFLLHRHRTYNPRERVWMGWERKRGKLLDLNHLLRGRYDSFPVKVGDLSLLPQVRFVITLDADTELPRGSAQRMVGALAHPLNQAIVDREDNVVVAGYGILQPRVGVSVQSAARSRLAKIYSGQTGLDIYTCAVSDVYQDLYGEGTFAGKGIYEVDVLLQTLDGRFPHNALLSHDLIEGAYARAGLVSDIQIIEDYPSHYSAYNRRKHRWLRGDWQIAEWVGSRVPGEDRKPVRNPISLISQWKILDNLRRSLVEPATFLLLLLGWLVLPGKPVYWTLATIAILFVPAWCRSLFELVRAAMERKLSIVGDALRGLFAANVNVILMLTFLAHQMLLSFDAMIRTLVRRLVTQRRLLQWETAAEAELAGEKRTPLDVYLDWTPALALGLGLLLLVARRGAFAAALPILVLWACSKLVSVWLNLPTRPPRTELAEKDRIFLRKAALRTWRYFAEFSTAEHNWLIPDNVVQESPLKIAARVSPTNLGLLLNARQVACRFGFLTVSEFAELTQRTLEVYSQLAQYRGHPFNWYDTRTLEPLTPRFVSSVDSGNLAASLWTLAQGCQEQLRLPILSSAMLDGLMDHLRILLEHHAISRRSFASVRRALHGPDWLRAVIELPDAALNQICAAVSAPKHDAVRWFADQAQVRLFNIHRTVQNYAPWLLPEFDSLRDADPVWQWNSVALDRLPDFIARLAAHLHGSVDHYESEEQRALSLRLQMWLVEAQQNSAQLITNLKQIVTDAEAFANAMDFKFLLHPQRKLLAVGFDVEAKQLQAACYDLLASESRTALFLAIAKDDVPQESWFQLGRPHTLEQGRPILRSWTGTMFEYLMPSIWIRSYPGTLLDRSISGAVRVQRAHTAARHIPWGISECACVKKDDAGNYGYFAFGVARLAVHKGEMNALVISPYSTMLALPIDPEEALKNLYEMSEMGWISPYGFYESADYSIRRRRWGKRYELVHCWMAHHQGMSLLALANFLGDGMVQRWFHREPRVQATELLLQEKPVAYIRPSHEKYGSNAA